jgi:hypothetical protein
VEELGTQDGTSREGPADSNADGTLSGRTYDAVTSLEPTKANGGPIGARGLFTKTLEHDGDHAEGSANEAMSEERAAQNLPHDNITRPVVTAAENSKEVMDENGEEVVEAAEDTVIY